MMEYYPDPFLDSEIKPAGGGDTVKDGLSERKPLFDNWGDTRVPQTPRTATINPHNKEE